MAVLVAVILGVLVVGVQMVRNIGRFVLIVTLLAELVMESIRTIVLLATLIVN